MMNVPGWVGDLCCTQFSRIILDRQGIISVNNSSSLSKSTEFDLNFIFYSCRESFTTKM